MSQNNPDGTPKLQQTLGFWQVAFYGTGSMLGAGIYALIGKAAGSLGNAMWLAFLAAMIGALLTGLSYAAVGSRYPKAGGAAFVTHEAFRLDWLSYVVGIAVMMSGLTSMATGSQAIIGQFQKAFAGSSWAISEMAVKPLAIVVVFLIGLVIYRGIKESMWLNIVCTVIEASGLLFIIAIGMKFWGSVNYLEMPPSVSSEGSGFILMLILQGAVLTFYSFIGFEDILNVSEEVKNPQRNVPRGLIAAMLIATGIYMAVAITAVSVVPWKELGASTAPLMDVAKRAAPWFANIDSVYVGIAIFAIANTALLNYLMGSRLLYGMSTQGLLPKLLGKLHPERNTPHVAVVTLFVIVATLIMSANVKQLAEATVLLLLAVFTTVNFALLTLKRRQPAPEGTFDVPTFVPLLGALVCATLIAVRVYSGVTSSDPDNKLAPLVAGTIIIVALILYRILKPKQVLLQD